MKNFDNYSCLTRHVLRTHWQKIWLILFLFAMPTVLQANFVSIASAAKSSNTLLFSKTVAYASLWQAMNVTTSASSKAAAYDGGDFSLDFVASAPLTYDHTTGGGAYDDRTIGRDDDVVESLEGGDFTCGDIVTFLTQITVANDAVGAQTIELDYSFLADATGQPGVALADIVNVEVNYGDVDGDGPGGTDAGIVDDGGSTATLTAEQLTGPLFQNGSELEGTVSITDLEAGEKVVVRVDVRIACDPGSSPTGNLQADITAGLVVDPEDDVISVGNQTIPFKNVNQIIFPTCAITPATAVCTTATTAYTATSDVADATYKWSITGNGTIVGAALDGTKTIVATGGATSTSVSVLAGAPGSYTLSVEISKTGFGTQTCSQMITVNPLPVVTADPKSVCVGASVGLTGSPAGGSWSGTGVTGSTFSAVGLTAGPYTVTYTYTDATTGCTNSATATITVNAIPNAPEVSPVSYCVGETPVALTATGSNLLWYDSPEDMTGSATAPTPSTATAGTFTFYVTQTVNNCESARAALVVTVNANPVVTTGSYGPLCVGGAAVTLGGSPAGGVWTGTGVSFNATLSAYVFTPTTAGSFELTYTYPAPNGNTRVCGGSATTTIVVNAVPAAPNVSVVNNCNGTSTLTASNFTGTLLWSTGETTAQITVNAPGTYTVTQTVNGCVSPAGSGVAAPGSAPAAPTVAPVDYCVGETPVALTATGSNLLWYDSPEDMSGSATAPTPSTASAGTTTYYVTQTVNGCESPRAALVVTINPNPVATAGVSGDITCQNTSVTLSGSANIAVASYAWTGPNGFTSALQNPTVNTPGTYILTVTTAAGCFDTDQVVVDTDTDVPVVTAGMYGPLCVDAPAVTLGGTPSGGTWTGTGVAAITGGYQFNPAVAGVGSHELTYSYTSTNGCTGTAKTTIVVIALPTAYTLNGGFYCEGTTPAGAAVSLADSDTGINYQLQVQDGAGWNNVGDAVAGTGTGINFGLQAAGTYRVVATTATGGCDNTFGEAVVRVAPRPNANAGGDMMLTCEVESVQLQGSSTTENVSFSWSTTNGNIVSGGNTATPTVNAAGIYTLTVTNNTTGCTATDVVEVDENDDLPDVRIRAQVTPVLTCTSQEIGLSALSSTPGVTYSWTGPNGFTSTASGINVTVGGTYTVTVTNPTTGCSASASITVTDIREDFVANAGPDKVLSCTVTQVTLQGSVTPEPTGVHWTASNGGHIVSGAFTLNPVVDAPGTYTLFVVDTNSGCNATDVVVVTREETNINVTAQGGTLDCVTGTVQLMGSSTTAGVVYSWSGPNGYTSNEQNPTVSVAGNYTLTVSIPNTDCSANTTVAVLPAQVVVRPVTTCYKIDFDGESTGLIESISTDAGEVGILGRRRMSDGPIDLGNHAAIFDTGMPTGDDDDLHTMDWGNVLIINQDRTNVPNDNQWGGQLELDFSAFGPVTMTSLKALDIDEYEDWSWVVLYDGEGNELYRVQLQPLGDNSKQTVDLGNTEGVMMMRVYLDGTGEDYVGSGAIDEIEFCIESEVQEPCVTPEPELACYEIDFEQDGTGLIESTTTNAGEVGILGRRRMADGPIDLGNHAAIFDSGNPTGDDDDLHTMDWGNVLIINQDRTNVPNDNQWGGQLELDFSAFGPVTMTSLKALDIDEYEDWSWVVLYDGEGNELYHVQLQPLGDNSKQTVDLGNTEGVMMMRVYLDGTGEDYVGSGAIDDIKFCIGDDATPQIRPLSAVTKTQVMKAATAIEATAYPMPFSDRTTLEFKTSETQDYVVNLYDSKGQLVRELKAGNAKAGELVTVEVDGRNLPEGMYFANIVGKAGVKKSVKLINRK
ncbi:T9SS type A sorting domain-containing protein [Pontibacter sp. H259]|uniref:Ig-like domain-containing protein n=1 Tax=Pontibacter sp. H259 TaxID=3133421 RepID=UPI0030BEC9E1